MANQPLTGLGLVKAKRHGEKRVLSVRLGCGRICLWNGGGFGRIVGTLKNRKMWVMFEIGGEGRGDGLLSDETSCKGMQGLYEAFQYI